LIGFAYFSERIAKPGMSEKVKINRLKIILTEKEISQKDFAKMVKKTPNTITRICNNDTQPSLRFLREMAIVLDVEICDLLVPVKPRR
jgi:putative transcriptional regulator